MFTGQVDVDFGMQDVTGSNLHLTASQNITHDGILFVALRKGGLTFRRLQRKRDLRHLQLSAAGTQKESKRFRVLEALRKYDAGAIQLTGN